jgi:beta-fructofuranosidase
MRPTFHFTAEKGWINDPHGITYRDGGYDVFFQYVPGQTVWGPNCEWGHARGRDLLSLERLPAALTPGDGDDGIWTGSLVPEAGGVNRIFYTSVRQPDIGIGRIRVATTLDPELIHWDKGAVVIEAPNNLDVVAYRDPFVFRDGDLWRLLVGAGFADGTAAAIGYTSSDLESWEYDGISVSRSRAEHDPVWMGALWECPQLIRVDGRDVLVSSVWDDDVLYYAGYGIGTFGDGLFTADIWGQLTFGPSYYAPSFFRDADGRPCLTFWMRHIEDIDAGWAGAHSIPYLLGIVDGHLTATPHPDVARHLGAPLPTPDRIGQAAFVAEWSPSGGGALDFATNANQVFSLEIVDEILTARVSNGGTLTVPVSGIVTIIVDGPVVEVASAGGLLGFPISPEATTFAIKGDTSQLTVRPWSH